MSRTLKRILIVVGGAVALLIVISLVVPLFVDLNHYKPRVVAAASDALGMEVRLGGRLGMGLFPGPHVTVEDGRILDAHGVTVASAKRVRLWIRLLPLLRREFRLHRIELNRPGLSIERAPGGELNVEGLRMAVALLGVLDGARVSLSDGTLRYADRRSGGVVEATDFDLTVSRMKLAGEGDRQRLKDLSIEAHLACGEIRTNDFSVSALRTSVDGKNGVFEFEPVTMRLFGGVMTGHIQADVSGPVPLWRIRCSLPQFRIEDFLATLSPKEAATGAMDFSANLSMQGGTTSRMVQTATGAMSLRGENLVLVGNDLDGEISRFESSQHFNLVDVGAVFLAGPLGLAATKGYNFASLFQGSGGSSRIGTLVSDWRVERGVAHAKDVALATTGNRIALQGGLDFVNRRFVDVTVAVVDSKGCATVRQVMRGSFEKPEVEKPRILMSLAGPVIKLYRQTRGLFPTGPCEVFYSGSVVPPK